MLVGVEVERGDEPGSTIRSWDLLSQLVLDRACSFAIDCGGGSEPDPTAVEVAVDDLNCLGTQPPWSCAESSVPEDAA